MKFAESLENGPHANLAKFAGDWTGTTKTWFEPDVVADESIERGCVFEEDSVGRERPREHAVERREN